jgi:hypothetical protein
MHGLASFEGKRGKTDFGKMGGEKNRLLEHLQQFNK